jgi:conjugal transfer pilus assembly protein TraE
MDPALMKQNVGKLISQRNIFLIFSLLLTVATVLLIVLLFAKKERIVIVPTTGPTFWIEEGKASSGYIERMGIYLSDFLLNRSPIDVSKRNQVVLEHVHPSAFHEFRKLLQQDEASLIKNDQIFLFTIQNSAVDLANHSFIIEGDALILVGKKGDAPVCMQSSRKKYTLRFRAERGRLFLISMKKEEIL